MYITLSPMHLTRSCHSWLVLRTKISCYWHRVFSIFQILYAYVISHVVCLSVADINECDSSPCENGCTCADAINGYSCGSIAGYTGTHCETGKQLVGHCRFQQHKVRGKLDTHAWLKKKSFSTGKKS